MTGMMLGTNIEALPVTLEVADALFRRLYGETRATEFSWSPEAR